jgi:hypothetical protein
MGGEKEYIKYFGGEISWKMTEEWDDNISSAPRNFFRGGKTTNSAEDRGQREWGSGGSSPLVSLNL